ncbi:hypothetical protein BMETH_1566_1 [methanotrophic bacterial endosymbiont of Bathymodiolus sp.]|nr:hypothetical protein BMETH_1566_1 [methanotrophic bacterial endosymbiont of Bathymodiolus sp.]
MTDNNAFTSEQTRLFQLFFSGPASRSIGIPRLISPCPPNRNINQ